VAGPYSSVTSTSFQCVVPQRAVTGVIRVECGGEEATSLNSFTVQPDGYALFIESFEPEHGAAGTPVTITGRGFAQPIKVEFSGSEENENGGRDWIASVPTFVTSDLIKTTVPNNAVTGPIQVTVVHDRYDCESKQNFQVP